jgi:WXG100 family type VII secretion target
MIMDEIYIDCEKYRQLARKLRKLSGDLDDARSNLSSVSGFVGDVWQGAAAGAFLESGDPAGRDIERLRMETEDLAADADAAATAFEEAERRLKAML